MTSQTDIVEGTGRIVFNEVRFGFSIEFFIIVSWWILCSCNNIYINRKKLYENV